MKNYKGCWLHFFISIFIWSNFAKAQEINFAKLNADNGLSHNTIYDIAQDDHGIMWFATREGLNNYDGLNINSFYKDTNNGGLSGNTIFSVTLTNIGLLIGTNAGIDIYNPIADSFKSFISSDQFEGDINFIKLVDGNTFLGTTKGLYKIIDKNNVQQLLIGFPVRDIEYFKSGIFLVALYQRVIMINTIGETIMDYGKIDNPSSINETGIIPLLTIFRDSRSTIWLGTFGGLYYFDVSKENFIHFPLGNSPEDQVIRSIAEDNENLWFGTENGVYIYNKTDKSIINYGQSYANNPENLSDKSVYSLFVDRNGPIWIGTYFGGVNYTVKNENGIRNFFPREYKNSISGKAISDIIKTSEEKIWIGTEDGGISILDQNNSFDFLRTEDGLSSNNIHALEEDSYGDIWIGTYLGGLNRYHKKTKQISQYRFEADDSTSISSNYVYSIYQDKKDNLWIGTQNGLNLYDYTRNNFRKFYPEILGDKFIYEILEGDYGDLWFCTRNSGIYRYITKKDDITHYAFTEKNGKVVSAYKDSKGTLWFGTLDDGLFHYDPISDTIASFSYNKELSNQNIYGILEDNSGALWISTNRGLNVIHPEQKNIRHLDSEDGLTTNQFNFKSSFKDDNGDLYFGSVNGLNIIKPTKINAQKKPLPLRFKKLKLFNQEVPVTIDGILDRNINYIDTLTLKHNQNVFSIEYGAINYNPENAEKYAYMLEGFDEDWNYVGTQTTATYTNIPSGHYTFKVSTLPIDQNNSKRMDLEIHPPFWKTNLAYGIYLIVFLSGIYAYWSLVRFLHRQKLAVQVERMQKEQITEINSHKLNFFTFISHEFKTPLTLILASAEKFYKDRINQATPPEEILIIRRNADKLNRLITQLLEFRKIETDHAKYDPKKGDIILFLEDTFYAFKTLFELKNLEYGFKKNFSEYVCYFDPDKLEMIVTNILSNALKNTSSGKILATIKISNKLDEKSESTIEIQISDTGLGMEKEQIKRITDPFYHGGAEFISGNSGLGLSLVQSLVKFLKGGLHVESTPGNGTTVTVSLPLKLKNLHNVEKIEGNKDIQIDNNLVLKEEIAEELLTAPLSTHLKMLIVEDNVELVKFLKKHFSKKFQVIVASDGRRALEKMERIIPDIIISDIRMPNLSGIELCKKVKSNPDLKHIPFFLLTAKSDEKIRIEALNAGANMYLDKPFNLSELELLATNLLETEKNLEKRLSEINIKQEDSLPKNNQDLQFLRKITKIVDDNFQNSDFGVEKLADLMGISRSLLHLKIKKITGNSSLAYIKRVRLRMAKKLIQQGYSISEVAYKVGYNDPNYFSRAFKKEFDITPTQFVEKVDI